jgi:hypothetical protein
VFSSRLLNSFLVFIAYAPKSYFILETRRPSGLGRMVTLGMNGMINDLEYIIQGILGGGD